jgi:uncharacterized membrane protein
MDVNSVVEIIGTVVEIAGVGIIVAGALVSSGVALVRAFRRRGNVYVRYRSGLGRSILLGLELLVAADIVRTVAITPTLESVAILAGIVLIRTFLSFSLELEISGRWPWQKRSDASRDETGVTNASRSPQS